MGQTINQKVANWARSRVGQLVGRGECWDLADQALRSSGARSSTTAGSNDDYVWGTPVELKDVIPGDILQFRDFTITIRTEVRTTFPDGSWTEEWRERSEERPHHTAIVEANPGKGRLSILEQNFPAGAKVTRRSIFWQSQPSAIKSDLRKNMRDRSGRTVQARVVTTEKITVSGRIWAYRPVPQ